VYLLLASTVLGAQSRGKAAKADALTGTWTGELSVVAAPRPMTVTLELKLETGNAVSGTLEGFPNPGEVKRGRFDPKTGALNLDLGKKGDPAVLITLDGAVVKNIASGRISGAEGSGEFKLTKKTAPSK
jgi:hypothetical protein